MAMSLAESAALMQDLNFRGRVKVAALKYAQYIQIQANQSVSRLNWAKQTMQNPDLTAQTLAPNVIMNVNVQSAGASIDDANLESAVNYVADSLM